MNAEAIYIEFDTGAMMGYLPNYTTTLKEVMATMKRLAPKAARRWRMKIEAYNGGTMTTFWKNLER